MDGPGFGLSFPFSFERGKNRSFCYQFPKLIKLISSFALSIIKFKLTRMTSTTNTEQYPVIRKVLRFGAETSIPDFDVCRLTFYLKCCILGCGMDAVVDARFLDYANAHCLSGPEQLYALQLALGEFSLDRLINRAIFIDDQSTLLPPDISNAFFKTETAATIFNVQLAGTSSVHVRKVMLCTTQWINEIYVLSIAALKDSYGNLPVHFPLMAHETYHCLHCRGMQAHCTCEAGCLPTWNSCCSTIHRGVVCHECSTGGFIVGVRYRCLCCRDCDLCQMCYLSGEHDQTHAFEKVCRPNAPPLQLLPRGFVLTADSELQKEVEDIPSAVAVSIETAIVVWHQ
jgi:hypothetical protein